MREDNPLHEIIVQQVPRKVVRRWDSSARILRISLGSLNCRISFSFQRLTSTVISLFPAARTKVAIQLFLIV